MSLTFFIFPTEFDSKLNIENIKSLFEKAINYFFEKQNRKINVEIKRFDVLSYPFRSIPWEKNEEFTWRHHEIEEVNISWKDETGEIFGECEIWNDYLSSSFVGTLADFAPDSIPHEIAQKVEQIGFHWKFICYADSLNDANSIITAILGATLTKLCNGIIMFDYSEQDEGIPPLNAEEFLQIFTKLS